MAATWRKSSFSNGQRGNCVEVAPRPDASAVRDSKYPDLGHLAFPAAEWRAFLDAAKREEL